MIIPNFDCSFDIYCIIIDCFSNFMNFLILIINTKLFSELYFINDHFVAFYIKFNLDIPLADLDLFIHFYFPFFMIQINFSIQFIQLLISYNNLLTLLLKI